MTETPNKIVRGLQSFGSGAAVGATGLVAGATVFSAYGGYFDPAVMPVAAMALMVLPIALITGVFMLVVDLIFWRKASVLIAAAWLVSLPELLVFFPLNAGSPDLTEQERDSSFTVLTYNIIHFWNTRSEERDYVLNPTIEYILGTDADIVNIQELEPADINPNAWRAKNEKVRQSQIDRLFERYPYRYVGSYAAALFSKFPIRHEKLPVQVDSMPNINYFKINIRGHEVNFYNVHLKSLNLTDGDKQFYLDLYHKPASERELKEEIKKAKSTLGSKIKRALVARAREARILRQCIDSVSGPVIVAGDFNDVPGCYAVRTIMDGDLHDAYAEAAFGPTITYHENRFYFRIDQILYRGPEIIGIKRGNCPYSDHYPLLATFTWKQ